MRSNPNARLVPIAVFPAIMPAILTPVLRRVGTPDYAIGLVVGACIGLAIVALFWMVKTKRGCIDG